MDFVLLGFAAHSMGTAVLVRTIVKRDLALVGLEGIVSEGFLFVDLVIDTALCSCTIHKL
jgi:hypothetical protein